MKLLFCGLEPWEKEYIGSKMNTGELGLEVSYQEKDLDIDNLPANESDFDAEIISVFVNARITREVIEKFPNLKYIVTRSTGYDHVDLVACAEKGIIVSNVPSYGEDTVAEYAFALILSLSRKIFTSVDQIKETGSFSTANLRGFDLQGKTLGVIGTGKIGKNVIRIGKGFEMKVVAFDAVPNTNYAKEAGFEYKSLDEVLMESDVVTIHVPYLPETHHLINKNNIGKIKHGALLINTSRGPVVETEALVDALKSGNLGGAGLDVLEEEGVIRDEMSFLYSTDKAEHNIKTIIANHILIDMPNVLITPHNAFNTWEALKRILDTTIENIIGYKNGQLVNIVKRPE
jgi:D-lactate dehydrogenase